ncbi:MAG: phenylalanine--tRNA ligase subunit alpha [Turicibacter sp.]|nr:phenylalanine--tRNA ligase subunit alpha [Turicibacter sp.]
MLEQLKELAVQAEAEIKVVSNLDALNDLRVKYLGKKGPIQEVMKNMKDLSPDERKAAGQVSNDVKRTLSEAINAKKEALELAEINKQLAEETIDVTLPAKKTVKGGLHPLNAVIADIETFFIGMGYTIAEGSEVESDHYNFELLNLPQNHPARDMQDSFYLDPHHLLRTHTSPIQVRTLEAAVGVGPVKILCPGKVYRRDDDDATHSHQFMQIEGLVVDTHITMADLKGTLQALVKHLFGAEREIRMRPSFFPFTEPSVEVDVSCFACGGTGCSVCKQTGWIEILDAGMVHPNVLQMSGFDPEKYQGFAFGMGVERIAMLKYGVEDIRHFYTNDLRFLSQFKGGVK